MGPHFQTSLHKILNLVHESRHDHKNAFMVKSGYSLLTEQSCEKQRCGRSTLTIQASLSRCGRTYNGLTMRKPTTIQKRTRSQSELFEKKSTRKTSCCGGSKWLFPRMVVLPNGKNVMATCGMCTRRVTMPKWQKCGIQTNPTRRVSAASVRYVDSLNRFCLTCGERNR